MQSLNNSLRLNRLLNTTEMRKKSTTEHLSSTEAFKLPALNAINKSVKYNELSFVTGRDLNKLRKQPEESSNLDYISAHQNLASIRKKYDLACLEKLERESKIAGLKEEKEKYQIFDNEWSGRKSSSMEGVKDMDERLINIKQLLESTQMQKKVLMGMQWRLKEDKIVYDLRKFNEEKELAFLKKQKNIIVKEESNQSEELDRTEKVYIKLNQHLQAEIHQRNLHLRNLEQMKDQKESLIANNQFREREIADISEKAMLAKDSNQNNWLKIYLCHKLVENLLKNKMNQEMSKFKTVEDAFKNIKIATGVNESDQLIKKFLNKQHVYGELLGKIAENQKKIQILKKEKQDLDKERKILDEENELFTVIKKNAIELRKELKQMDEINVKQEKDGLFIDKIIQWISKNFKKFHSFDKSIQSSNITKSHKQIIENFTRFLKTLEKEITISENQANDHASSDSIKGSELTHHSDKIFRVKPKTKKINGSGEEVHNEFDEQEVHGEQEDDDHLNTQRIELLRNNDKFMKDLKRKMEEQKKALLDAAPKVKENKSPEKPKAQVQEMDE